MKLLICDLCHDVVGLAPVERACACGESSGRYTDELHVVEVEGPCRVLGFPNRLIYGTADRGETWLFHEPHDRIIRKGRTYRHAAQEALIELLQPTL